MHQTRSGQNGVQQQLTQFTSHSPKTHGFPPFSRWENGRISAHKRATDKSGVLKEAQDNGLSAGMSYGRQTLPRRPSGRNGDISHRDRDISQQKNGDNWSGNCSTSYAHQKVVSTRTTFRRFNQTLFLLLFYPINQLIMKRRRNLIPGFGGLVVKQIMVDQ